jgi:hypothetical protein
MKLSIRSTAILLGVLVSALMAAPALAAYLDPPGRVARVGYIDGEVSFSPAGEDTWVHAVVNRSLIRGDRLWADRRSRVELQLGAAAIRLDQMSSAEILDLDDTYAQVFLAEGSLNIYVRRIWDNQVYEIATPTLAVVIRQPGSYRIDVDPNGRFTDVTVWNGGADAYGDRANLRLRPGEKIRFHDASLRDYRLLGAPRADNFDRFAFDRDRLMDSSPSLRYVSDDLIGYTDLDRYGRWSSHREYGAVWYPTRVSSGWAPYRHGHWAWIEPFGWTWVDQAPWGFAVSHYGRWVYVSDRWGWVPSPRTYRAVYSPALVAFVGGSNWSLAFSSGVQPIGWFPLGPRDVWFPSYRVSSNYFTRVNVHNTVINNVTVVNIYNNYYVQGGNLSQVNYRYRQTANAHTVVSQDVFTRGRSVQQGLLSATRGTTARAEVQRLAPVAPTARSLTGVAQASKTTPRGEVFQRQAVTSRAPAAAATSTPFRARQEALQRQPGVPQAVQPRQAQAAAAAQRPMRVVGQDSAPIDRQQVRGRSADTTPATQRGRSEPQSEQRAPARRPPEAAAQRSAPAESSTTPRAAQPRQAAPQTAAPQSRRAPEATQPRAAQPAQAQPRQAAPQIAAPQPRRAPETVQPRAAQPAQAQPRQAAPQAATPQPRRAPETVQPRAAQPVQAQPRQAAPPRAATPAPQQQHAAPPARQAAPPPRQQTREDEDDATRSERRDPPPRGRGRDGGGL